MMNRNAEHGQCSLRVRPAGHVAEPEPMVRRCASRRRSGVRMAENALERFGRGSSFETYAARRIEGSMLDALREMDTMSRGGRARMRAAQEAVRSLEQRGRAPRAKEVANELEWSLEEFHRCIAGGAASVRTDEEELENRDDGSAIRGHSADDQHLIDEHANPLHALQQRQRHIPL